MVVPSTASISAAHTLIPGTEMVAIGVGKGARPPRWSIAWAGTGGFKSQEFQDLATKMSHAFFYGTASRFLSTGTRL
jgi:hypothetical protein